MYYVGSVDSELVYYASCHGVGHFEGLFFDGVEDPYVVLVPSVEPEGDLLF